MKPGTIVEYIEQQQIICAVVVEYVNNRLTLINELGREVNQSVARIFFVSDVLPEYGSARENMVAALKATAERRRELTEAIDLKELWELVNGESEWIELKTLAEFRFPTPVTSDQTSAMIRAVFSNRLYFKFDHTRFFPHSPEQVERILAQAEEERKRRRLVEEGGRFIKRVFNETSPTVPDEFAPIPKILKSIYIFDKESPHYALGKEMLAEAGISSNTVIFKLLVKLGVFSEDENIDLYSMEIPRHFPDDVLRLAQGMNVHLSSISDLSEREDYTHVRVVTIDGQSTTDFDDALSLERIGESYVLGIHISDVAHLIKRDDLIDKRAFARGASIYMADDKIPMLPPDISENAASLKQGELRPAISVIVTLNRFFEIKDFEVIATRIKVDRQLSYSEVNAMAEDDPDINVLIKIAKAFRQKRLSLGATHITLPEVNVFLDDAGEIMISRVDRESHSRMMVAEMMIMGNWMMASFLSRNGVPAIFRSQQEPKERLYRGESDSLFLNCLQRKYVNRAIISHKAAFHAGLGLDAYVTATSPIRRYHDLVTQRQIRAILGLEEPYSQAEVTRITQMLDTPISNVGKIQFNRRKYWLLKYLESRIGEKTPGLVLERRRNSFTVLLTDYMLEYSLPASGLKLKPQDTITMVIQHANARKDSFSVFISY